jgi:hypothetical protein
MKERQINTAMLRQRPNIGRIGIHWRILKACAGHENHDTGGPPYFVSFPTQAYLGLNPADIQDVEIQNYMHASDVNSLAFTFMHLFSNAQKSGF